MNCSGMVPSQEKDGKTEEVQINIAKVTILRTFIESALRPQLYICFCT